MTDKASAKWSHLKEKLSSLDKSGLIGLVKVLFEYSADNRAFLAARFLEHDVSGAALEEYRRRIIEQFYPKRGFGKLRLSEARKAIRDYRKATVDLAGTLELMLTYVENGTRFTCEFGDINEAFYESLESVLDELVDLLKAAEGRDMYLHFQHRLLVLAKQAEWIGWGYGDYVTDAVKELEVTLGKR